MKRAALYTADPWDSALVEIRIRRPAALAGVEILQGFQAGKIHTALIEQVDLVIIQRDFPRFPETPLVIQTAQDLHKPVIYETDDWLFDVPDWNVQQAAYRNYLNGMLWAITQADRVVTSNHFLAKKLALFNPNVQIFENYLVDELWPLQKPFQKENHPLTIGFMGSQTHQEDIRWLTPVLIALLDKYEGKINLLLWGCEPSAELKIRPDVRWQATQFQSYGEFAQYFIRQSCDIFIAPLSPNDFNRAKSALKYLEYSSLGIPGVYSKMDPYEHVITDGENGLLAANLQEWFEKLEALILTPDLRYALAAEAQQRITHNWLLRDHYPQWIEVVQGHLTPQTPRSPTQAVIGQIAAKTQQQIWEMETRIGTLSQEAADLRNNVSDLSNEVSGLRNHIEAVLASNTWKLALKFQKLINLVRPHK